MMLLVLLKLSYITRNIYDYKVISEPKNIYRNKWGLIAILHSFANVKFFLITKHVAKYSC